MKFGSTQSAGALLLPHVSYDRLCLGLILVLALVVRLAGYAVSPGLMHPDEIFQYAEAAHRLVFGQGVVPWEYRYGLRSWLFPGILAGVMELARPIGSGPIVQNTAIACFLSLASLPSVAVCFFWARRAAGLAGGVSAAILVAAWSESALIAVHPLLDFVAMDTLVPGLFLLARARHGSIPRGFCLIGLLFGLTAVFRPQYAPVIGWCWLRICYGAYRRSILPLAAGFAVPLLVCGLLDWITLGFPFLSFIRYLAFNAGGGADYWGVAPWYTYLVNIRSVCGSFFPLILICMIAGARWCWLPLEAAIAFIVTLSTVRHKELRFILPVLPLLLTVAGAGSARLLQSAMSLTNTLFLRSKCLQSHASVANALLPLGWLAICGAHAHAVKTRALWARGTDIVELMHEASLDKTACGLAIVPLVQHGGSWLLGGYTHLRPGMTLTVFVPHDPPSRVTGFSYAIAEPAIDLSSWGLVSRRCTRNMVHAADNRCLWKNPAACNGPSVVPELTLPNPTSLAFPAPIRTSR